MKKTKIDWADSTWNPVTGCLHDCPYCYARGIARRFGGCADPEAAKEACRVLDSGNFLDLYELGQPLRALHCERGEESRPAPYPFCFAPTFHRYRLGEPARWTRPRNIFVCSMADLFGDWVPEAWIKDVFAACQAAPWHRYLFLTKNPKRYLELYRAKAFPYSDNIWLGSTVTGPDDEYVWVRDTPYHSFVSAEPLLKPLGNLAPDIMPEWLIVGAETGRRKDKVLPEKQWILDIADMCEETGVPLFMKGSFPEAAQLGDITKIDGGAIPPVDIISGGSPCQDLSIAGKRAGLEGERSGLFMDQMRIVRQMHKATGGKQPRYMIWENVPGAFSSNEGGDFHAILDEIVYTADTSRGGCGDNIPRPAGWRNAGAILGDGFSVAWRVLDAQFWGVPQRRRRIFLVADFRGTTAPKILFERESERRHIEARRKAREGTAGAFKESAGGSGVSGSLMQPKSAMDENWHESDVCNALRAGESRSARAVVQIEGLLNDQGGSVMHHEDGAVSPTIRAQTKGNEPIVYHKANEDATFSVDCRNGAITPETHGTLQAKENGGQSLNYSGALLTFARQSNSEYKQGDITSTQQARQYKQPTDLVCRKDKKKYTIRRLTPLECERLQGFPDGWTNIPHNKKHMSDSARYRMLGNSVAVPCVLFIMDGIAGALSPGA